MNFKTFTKIAYLILFVVYLLATNSAYSQCNNPTPTGSTMQEFCASSQSQIQDLVVSGGDITWYNAATGGNAYDPSEFLVTGAYYADDLVGGDCSTSRLEVMVTVYANPPTNVNISIQVCENNNPTISNLTAIGNNIQWYTAETGGDLLSPTTPLQDGFTYWVQQSENGCVSTRTPTLVNFFNVQAPAIPIDDLQQEFCENQMPMVLDLFANNEPVVWYASQFSTTPLDDDVLLVNGQDYWAAGIMLTCESTTRTQVTVVIDEETNAGQNTTFEECLINLNNPINLFDNLDGMPDANGTWSGPSTLTNGYLGTYVQGVNMPGTYTYTVESLNGICVQSQATIMVTELDSAIPTTNNLTQPFCEIEMPTVANLQANGNNIQWYNSATSTTPLLPTELLIDGNTYYATQTDNTSNCESSQRLEVLVNITTISAPTTSNATPEFCEIENPTISDLQVTGNTIQWYNSATSTTPLDTTALLIDGTSYYATQTDTTTGCESSQRLEIAVTISTTNAPTTTNATPDFCEIEMPTIANLQANGNNIQWYNSTTSTTPLDTTALLIDGTTYYATQTDTTTGCESSQRLEIAVTINTINTPTTTNATPDFCEIEMPTIANLQANGNNIQWYDSPTSTTPLLITEPLINGTSYYATQTDATTGCESSQRLEIAVTISTTNAPTTSNATPDFCEIEMPTIANLQVTGNNIQWYNSATSTTPLDTTALLIDGTGYYATQTDATTGCESSQRLEIAVTISTTNTPTTTNATPDFCEIEMPTIANLQASGNNIQWYDSPTSTTPLLITEPLINGTTYYATQTNATTGCESATRLEVTVQIISQNAPTTNNATQEFCELTNPTISDIEIAGDNILWYISETATTPLSSNFLIEDNTTYYATQTNATSGCESIERLEVLTIFTLPDTPVLNDIEGNLFCIEDNPTIESLSLNVATNANESLIWYDNYPTGNQLNTQTQLIHEQTYYGVAINSNGCESSAPLIVTVELSYCYEGVIIYDGFSPNGDNVNDTFHIKNIASLYPNYEVEFYNRWGNILYTSNANKPDWNGTLNGKGEPLPVGVYYYIIKFNDNNRQPEQGKIYLSR